MAHPAYAAAEWFGGASCAARSGSAGVSGKAVVDPSFDAFAFDETGHFSNVSQVRAQSVLDESLDSYNDASAMGLHASETKALVRLEPGRGADSEPGQRGHYGHSGAAHNAGSPTGCVAWARVDIGGFRLFMTCAGTGRPPVVLDAGGG